MLLILTGYRCALPVDFSDFLIQLNGAVLLLNLVVSGLHLAVDPLLEWFANNCIDHIRDVGPG